MFGIAWAADCTPAAVDWGACVSEWAQQPDRRCAVAAAANMAKVWTANHGAEIPTPDVGTLSAAHETITTTPGLAADKLIRHWRATALFGAHIFPAVTFKPQQHDFLRSAVYLFGAVYISAVVHCGAQDDMEWDNGPNRALELAIADIDEPVDGSRYRTHAITCVGFDDWGVTVVSWGALHRMSWRYLTAFGRNAFATLSTSWADSNRPAPNGLTWHELSAAVSTLGTRI